MQYKCGFSSRETAEQQWQNTEWFEEVQRFRSLAVVDGTAGVEQSKPIKHAEDGETRLVNRHYDGPVVLT